MILASQGRFAKFSQHPSQIDFLSFLLPVYLFVKVQFFELYCF